jgi:hypothetical protein
MRDETKFANMKSEFDSIKIELGITINERNKIQQELKEKYQVKSSKEIIKLQEKMAIELEALRKKKEDLFNHIDFRLNEFRR